ncbi:MAG: carboxylesterase/lipase family protein [Myxococcales bacterium]|nr:carboxylesterase/lipase family protein [Myxococcales bacterium]MDD9967637.1 carboxylesterase/lipase family protein [Myxococcales bacterium]
MTVEVATTYGMLAGDELEGLHRFRGIPYAAPPTGERRFAAPVAPESWSGVREALAFGGSAPQPISTGVLPVGRQDEDCLYLNVYTPAADDNKRPVMCFIHGGAFFLGSSSEDTYDGAPLVRRGDVVVVTLNYRLGALGFLDLGSHGGDGWGAQPNAGLLDQVAALRWVRDNIAAFGGDPDNVTIFGESAGAASVCALLAMPSAKGLYKRAIAQSGHANRAHSPESAAQRAEMFLQALGLTRADAAQLRALPVDAILTAQATAQAGDLRAFGPVVDGEVIPELPLTHVLAGGARSIPLLIGTNRDESKLFVDPRRPEIDDATLLRRAARLLPRVPESQVGELVETFRDSRRSHGLPHGNNDMLDALTTASTFRIPAIRLAEVQVAHQPQTFVYEFDWRSPAWRGTLGAAHAIELPFVFGTLGSAMVRLTGTGPEAEALSERMMDAWLAFARTGDPSCGSVGDWPPYEAATRPTMIFDARTRLERAPFEAERARYTSLTQAHA